MTEQHDFEQAAALADEGRWHEAAAALERLALARQDSAAVQAKLGYVYWELEDRDRAIERFRSATRLAPRSETASLALFHSLWEQGNQAAALEEAKRFMKISESAQYRRIIQDINAAAGS